MMKQTGMVRSFGRFVRVLRKERGLTRPEFARRCGLSDEYLKDFERGHIDPSFSALNAIARALDMDPDELIERVAAYDKGVIRRCLDYLRDYFRRPPSRSLTAWNALGCSLDGLGD